MACLPLICEARAPLHCGDSLDPGQRDPAAQAYRGHIFPKAQVSFLDLRWLRLLPPLLQAPCFYGQFWAGLGSGEREGGRGWFWSHFEHSGTGEDIPSIWIRFSLPPSTRVTRARGKKICQEVIARKGEESQDLKTALTRSGLRKPGCWLLRINESCNFRTFFGQDSICSSRILPWLLHSSPTPGFPLFILSLSVGPSYSNVTSPSSSPFCPSRLKQQPHLNGPSSLLSSPS